MTSTKRWRTRVFKNTYVRASLGNFFYTQKLLTCGISWPSAGRVRHQSCGGPRAHVFERARGDREVVHGGEAEVAVRTATFPLIGVYAFIFWHNILLYLLTPIQIEKPQCFWGSDGAETLIQLRQAVRNIVAYCRKFPNSLMRQGVAKNVLQFFIGGSYIYIYI